LDLAAEDKRALIAVSENALKPPRGTGTPVALAITAFSKIRRVNPGGRFAVVYGFLHIGGAGGMRTSIDIAIGSCAKRCGAVARERSGTPSSKRSAC
jgi:hypothetical protein